jgi:hypothetical protein
MQKSRLAGGITIMVGALLTIVGSFLPWAKAEGTLLTLSKKGTEGDGMITLIAGVIILVMGILMLLMEKNTLPLVFAGLGGLGCAAVAVIDLVDIADKGFGIKAGEGIYMVLVGGVIVVAGAVMGRLGSRTQGGAYTGAGATGYACPYCGNPVNQGDSFCTRCGARFTR